MLTNLVQLRRDDLSPGVPLQFSVFDQESRLVCGEGQVIDTAAGIEALIRKGVYRAAANEEQRHAALQQDGHAPASGSQECMFDDIRLNVGDALQLQSMSGSDRFYVKLIGYTPGGSVLVTTPTLAGRVLLMREGQGFIARAFSGRAAYAFNTAVTRVCNVPYPYLHLHFPKLVQGVAIRREARIRVRVIASVARSAAPGESVPAAISDLSPSGARIDARELLASKGEGFVVSFRLRFEQEDAYFVIDAIVRSVRKDRRGDDAGEPSFMHGVEFSRMPPNERLLLRTLILQHLAEGGRDETSAK